MQDKKLAMPASKEVKGDDVTTWALPDGAIARLGRGCNPDMAFSPDGQSLAICTALGLWLYDLATLSAIALWETERVMVGRVAFSPNGKWLAASNLDQILKVLDSQNGECLIQVETADYITGLTFSADNQYLAAAYGGTSTVEVWHSETGESLAKFTTDTADSGYDRPIALSPDTHLIASTSASDTTDDADAIVVWDVESGQQIAYLSGHTGWVTTLCFSPCGQFLASGGEDGTVYVWDVSTWRQVQAYTDFGDVYRIIPSYSPEGILRAAIVNYDDTGPATISVCDLESGEQLYTDKFWGNTVRFSNAGDWGNTVLFSNGSQLAYESRHEFINVWTPEYPYKRQFTHSPISFPAYECTSVSFPTALFSDDGKTLAVKHHHEGVILWDIASKRSRPAVKVESAGKNQFLYKTDSGKFYVASIKDDNVTLWEADGNGIPFIEGTGREYWSAFPALAPTGTLFAYADADGNLKVWDVNSGNQRYELKHPLEPNDNEDDEDDGDTIGDLQFSYDGKILASESDYPCAHVISWDMELGEEIDNSLSDNAATRILGRLVLRKLKPKSREVVHISHDGKYLSSIGNNSYLYDVKQNDYLTRLTLPQGLEDIFWAAKFSMCGKYFAAGTWWREGLEKMVICLWEVETGKQIVTFRGHPTDVHALAFSPDNKLLASTSYDGTILLWDLTPYL